VLWRNLIRCRTPPPDSPREREYFREAAGHCRIEESWGAFYEHASRSTEPFFVKTHRPPQDDQPCIYIVREGRKATLSYYYHLRDSPPEAPKSVLELVLGHDYYGDWTLHYRQWQPAQRPSTLLLRYEVVMREPDREIARITDFLGFKRPPEPWRNPFHRLQGYDPDFFRRGIAEWEPDPLWTPQIEDVFQARHAELMRELGYGPLNPAADFVTGAEDGHREFVRDVVALSERLKAKRAESERNAAAMLGEIERLSTEADKRLALIHQLNATAEERLREIQNLAAEAEKRRELIEKFHAGARSGDA
jgi:hypothetical protein